MCGTVLGGIYSSYWQRTPSSGTMFKQSISKFMTMRWWMTFGWLTYEGPLLALNLLIHFLLIEAAWVVEIRQMLYTRWNNLLSISSYLDFLCYLVLFSGMIVQFLLVSVNYSLCAAKIPCATLPDWAYQPLFWRCIGVYLRKKCNFQLGAFWIFDKDFTIYEEITIKRRTKCYRINGSSEWAAHFCNISQTRCLIFTFSLLLFKWKKIQQFFLFTFSLIFLLYIHHQQQLFIQTFNNVKWLEKKRSC